MRILIYGINFAPELTGIGKYTGEMAMWLASKGHAVKMITAKPYYPEWEIDKKYKKKIWYKEKIGGVDVWRAPLYVPTKPDSIKRIIHELSFQLGVIPFWLSTLFEKKYDGVVCITPAFHLGVYPLLYSRIRRTSLWTHIQDLQVDAAKELNMINNEILLKLMFATEGYLLRNSKIISSISEGMILRIQRKNIGSTPVTMFRNWVDSNVIRPIADTSVLRQSFGLGTSDKVILYSGNLGEKQGLELIVHVASRLSTNKAIQFLICGSGGNQDALKTMARDAELDNIHFFPLQPYDKLAGLLSMADVHLVLQKKSASDLVMPSKLTSILACGGVSIVSAVEGTTLYEVVHDNDIGIVIEPESVDALELGILQALNHESNNGIKVRARKFAEQYLDKEHILTQFEKELQLMVQKKL